MQAMRACRQQELAGDECFCKVRLKKMFTLPRELAGDGSLQATGACMQWGFAGDGCLQGKTQENVHPPLGACRRRELAGDGDLQAMGVCRVRLKKMFTLPRELAGDGDVQAMGICRRWVFAG